MTATRRPTRASKDVQSLTLGSALRGLGLALGTSATPRLEFQRDLRERLIEEARLLALQPKPPPRARRPRRPRGGGIRLAAIGIGFSLAGGGVVAAAHSWSLPAKAATPANTSSPGAAVTSHPPQARSPAAVTGGPMRPQTAASHAEDLLQAQPPPVPATAVSTPPAGSPRPLAAVASTLGVPSPTASTAFQPPEIGITISPQFKSSHRPAPAPTLVPTWLVPARSLSAAPSASPSPLR